MSETRRGFLKKLVGGAAGALAAPLVPKVETTDVIGGAEFIPDAAAKVAPTAFIHMMGPATFVGWGGTFTPPPRDDSLL